MYHFIIVKIGLKFSHLLTVRAEGADPPPYGQPDCKNTVFYDFPIERKTIKQYARNAVGRTSVHSYLKSSEPSFVDTF